MEAKKVTSFMVKTTLLGLSKTGSFHVLNCKPYIRKTQSDPCKVFTPISVEDDYGNVKTSTKRSRALSS